VTSCRFAGHVWICPLMLSPAFSTSATFVPGFAAPDQSDGTDIKHGAARCRKNGLAPFIAITLPKWAFFSNSPRAKTKERRTVTRQSLSIFGYPPGSQRRKSRAPSFGCGSSRRALASSKGPTSAGRHRDAVECDQRPAPPQQASAPRNHREADTVLHMRHLAEAAVPAICTAIRYQAI
jgi:hypothetical protein